MRAALFAWLALAGVAQAQPRPQLDAGQAASHTVAAYLAQGPSRWTPPPSLQALRAARADWVVAADGSGTHATLQQALDALPPAGTGEPGRRWVIALAPGTYRGQVCLRGKAPAALVGLGLRSTDVRIVANRYAGLPKRAGVDSGNPCLPDLAAGAYGTASSATLGVFSDDVQLAHLSVENDAMAGVRRGVGYPPQAAESGGAQAVALMTQGDRIHLHEVALLGHQDTLYVRASTTGDRVYVHQSLIAGDVDFIFGDGTLVVDDSTLLSRSGRRTPGHGGHILAPSTAPQRTLGILVHASRLIGEAGLAPGSISLGRAWDTGVAKGHWRPGDPNGQAVVRDSVLGAHVGPWAASTSRRAFQSAGAEANRMAEWRNQQVSAGLDIGRETLPAQDGWGSAEGGTIGGADASAERDFTVRTRAELVRALALPDRQPRIVRVAARIDLSTDDAGRPLGEADFRDPEFDANAFVRTYDPSSWGRGAPSGPLEQARQRSAQRQAAVVMLRVPSNTTIVGVGAQAALVNGGLMLDGVDNVIVRNLHLSDAYDHFPAWDPADGRQGAWNSAYDTLMLRSATHVWIDHCTLDDGDRPDATEPIWLGQRVQRHDGLLDIVRQSNWVTVSWNHFRHHDKTMLIGNSDAQAADAGRLKVSLHHNWFEGVRERTPRVRYGQVHVYNNLFEALPDSHYGFVYSIGIGHESRVVSAHNAWVTPPAIASSQLVRSLGGDRFHDSGSTHNAVPVDLLAVLRATSPGVPWSADVGWTPEHWLSVDSADTVPTRVRAGAGARRWASPALAGTP